MYFCLFQEEIAGHGTITHGSCNGKNTLASYTG
jgi:hypothetical protein